jgi:rhodanese-related sulfurtransferase
MKTFTYLAMLMMVGLLYTSYTEAQTPGGKTADNAGRTTVIKVLEPKDAQQVILENKGNPNFVLIDIRTPEEFESGHIAGAINLNYHTDSFIADLDKLDKSKTYMVYCRTGRRVSDTVGIMVRLGFPTIYRINGDINRWKSQGLPVVKP